MFEIHEMLKADLDSASTQIENLVVHLVHITDNPIFTEDLLKVSCLKP